MSLLAGKTALVTGAARRVGSAVAQGLARDGARCLLHYHRSKVAVEEVAASCRAVGVEAETVASDLAAEGGIETLAKAAVERDVSVLVHNASTFSRIPFDAPSTEHRAALERDLRLHVTAPYLLSRIVGAHMAAQGWGRIVVLGDWTSGAAVYPHYGPYLVSKAAVPTLVRVLALELGRLSVNVTANAILPGPLLPPENKPPAEFERVPEQTILGDWIGTDDVVSGVRFFVASGGVTGESLRIDGGRAARAL